MVATLIVVGCTPEEVCPSGSVRAGEHCRFVESDVSFPSEVQGVVPGADSAVVDDSGATEVQDGDTVVDETDAPDTEQHTDIEASEVSDSQEESPPDDIVEGQPDAEDSR